MTYFRFHALRDEAVRTLASEFCAARPFPHVLIPDVISVQPQDVLPFFPPSSFPQWLRYGDLYQAEKMTFGKVDCMPEPFRSMLQELSAAPFLEFLERLTGISGLMPDPYLHGAGLHCSGPGGVMAPHTDTHLNQRLGIFKRVNVLIYLNPDWEESYGGCLELFDHGDTTAPVRTVVPRWGTCVVFRTDARSVHGFSRPIVGLNRFRRAIVVYYYTSEETLAFSGDLMTHWRQHDSYWGAAGGSELGRRGRMYLYRSLRLGAMALAYLAHRTRPTAATQRAWPLQATPLNPANEQGKPFARETSST